MKTVKYKSVCARCKRVRKGDGWVKDKDPDNKGKKTIGQSICNECEPIIREEITEFKKTHP